MNFLPVIAPRISRLLFCFLLLLGISDLLSAQVNAPFRESLDSRGFEKNIAISWSTTDESQWHEAYDDRLDIMSLKVNIPAAVFQEENVFEYSLDFEKPCLIECLIHVNVDDPQEQIWLKDKNGKLIFNLKPQNKKQYLTPPFNPAEVSIVRSKVGREKGRSEISIVNIYYQPLSDTRGIGFNTALPCHPNAACKTDSLSKLISNSDVRIRLVMEEGIGWCTGAMVNNTRNDKSPFLLTAYHCTFNFTPHYDMWRFDFQYKSEACTNPAVEPAYFSLTGCELKASGQASDFLLVLLDNEIPSDQPVTFAGWNRNDVEVPDTTYLVHHPNADIRKFSTCTSSIVIHPNQIGWSEGYTTPANHHFRFKFTEGGHEKGSSGGPVFDQDGYLVGQLHGGTAGCEAENNAYVGRFSKSWNLGPSPPQRLKEWLDPDNTGVVQWPSIENIQTSDMVVVHGVVKDGMGRPVKNVMVHVSGDASKEMITDAEGKFEMTPVNRNGQYTITFEKNENPANGLNVFDLVAIQKHLLAKDTFDFNWQLIAADATNNNDITVGDILILLKLILGKISYLPSSPAWRFDPPQIVLESLPPGVQNELQPMGIKIGDVNGTSDPSQ